MQYGLSIKEPNEAVFASGFFQSVEYVLVRLEEPEPQAYARLEKEVQELIRLSKTYGVAIRSLHLPFASSEFFNFQPSAKKDYLREETLVHTKKLIALFAKAGIQYVVIHGSMRVLPEDRAQRVECLISYLKKLCDYCKELHIQVALENLMEDWIGKDADELLYILEKTDRENLGICYDTNHFVGKDYPEFIERVGKNVIATHISDNDFIWERHWFPGKGKLDWKMIVALLEKAGYSGNMTFEVGFGGEVTAEKLKELMDCWNHCMK